MSAKFVPYRLLRRLLRVSVRVFFRRIAVVGLDNVPAEGPVIFCGNHPNSLLDPVLITAFCDRIVHFAAKDTLFRHPLHRLFLTVLGGVPVRRRQDHPDGRLDNDAAFSALFEVLEQGRAMGIFPEGISHDGSQLAGLKTGAARIALGLAERGVVTSPILVPCGLHYLTRDRFRSSVLIQFGPPIAVDAGRLADWKADSREAARALTEDLDQRMRGLTVNAEDWETIRVLDGVRRLFRPEPLTLARRVELARRFNAHYPEVRGEPEVRQLFQRVQSYIDRMAAAGLNDRDLRRPPGPLRSVGRALAHLLLLLFWLPLALPGALIHLPIWLLLRVTSRHLAPRRDVLATTKFVAGFLLLITIYLAAPALAFRYQGWQAALAVGALLPFTGYATLRVGERAAAFRNVLRTSWRIARLGREIEAMGRERAELVALVGETVHRWAPADLPSLDEVAGEGS